MTLGRLALHAGVTKPVVYDHFGARPGLLAAMYREYDARQNERLDAALEARRPTLVDTARVISSSYVDCVLRQGREVTGVIAALAGSPELEEVKRDYETAFAAKCRTLLTPFVESGAVTTAGLRAMLGAAQALSFAAANGDISAAQAREELSATILSTVSRSVR